LCYLWREILEENEVESINKCAEIWKELKMLHHKHKAVLNPKLCATLSSLFLTVPNTLQTEYKKLLRSTIIETIRKLVLEVSDEDVQADFARSETLPKWLHQYYTYIHDGQLYSGFRGKSLHDNNHLAIYLHKDVFWANAESFGVEKAIAWHCHTVIHEMMHLHSHNGDGVNSWMSYSQITHVDARQKLDEGFTETFSRVIINSIRQDNNISTAFGVEAPQIVCQGSRQVILPVYEALKDVACVFIPGIGLKEAAKGYFLGQWEPFTLKVQENETLKQEAAWKLLNQISHTASHFFEQGELAEKLTSLGFAVTNPKDLHEAVLNNTYVDHTIQKVFTLLPVKQ